MRQVREKTPTKTREKIKEFLCVCFAVKIKIHSGNQIAVDHAKRGSPATPPFADTGPKDGLSILPALNPPIRTNREINRRTYLQTFAPDDTDPGVPPGGLQTDLPEPVSVMAIA